MVENPPTALRAGQAECPAPPSHRTLKTTMPEHAPILPVIAAEVAALAPVSAP